VYFLGPKLTITPHPPQNPQNMIQQSSNHDFELSNSGNINYNETWTWPSMQRAFFFLLASLFSKDDNTYWFSLTAGSIMDWTIREYADRLD
jgi:hypothetical protein